MWYHLSLLLLVGAAVVAWPDGAWKPGNEYQYLVRTRTLLNLETLPVQFSGILAKSILNIQVQSPEKLLAQISKPQYARVHRVLNEGWETEIPDQALDFHALPLSGNVFEIKLKHGVIHDILVDKSVATWELNLLKGLMTHLLLDAQGVNVKRTQSTQVPENDQPFAMFKAMEDSVSGKCEVLYDITPLAVQNLPISVPMPDLSDRDQLINIIKTKNHSRCEQRPGYHFGLTKRNDNQESIGFDNKFISESTNIRMIISGNLKHYSILSSYSTNIISVNPRIVDYQSGNVYSRMNLTLVKTNEINELLLLPADVVPAGNLMYSYSPFVDDELFQSRRPNFSDSLQDRSDDYNFESEKHHRDYKNSNEEQDDPLIEYYIANMARRENSYIFEKDVDVDVVRVAKNLINDIVHDLHKPNEICTRDTLEKFTILASVIRTLSLEQIYQVENNLYLSPNKANRKDTDRETNVWSVLRDAVAQAGTKPALKVITKWIVEKKLEGVDATMVLSLLPRTVRRATDEYIRMFFNMINKREVLEQRFVNETAPIAFTELLRYSYVDHGNMYPIHSSHSKILRKYESLLDTYVPYMADQLQKAVLHGDSTRIQAYIRALGNLGHPMILSVFEPYLEGKEPISMFQRQLIVASLDKLAEMYPDIAQSVLYKIYLNIYEAHELRCMAVYLLMKTNPPLSMLQRMAYSHWDNANTVDAVRTIIESSARLKRPDMQDLAKKAKVVKKILSPIDYGYGASRAYMMDRYDPQKDRDTTFFAKTIGSGDTIIPKAVDLDLDSFYNGFYPLKTEMGYAVTSVRKLLNKFYQNKKDPNQKSAILLDIAHLLKLKGDYVEQLEGNLHFNSPYGMHFYPFDNHSIDAINEKLIKYLSHSFTERQHLNVNKMYSSDVSISFPMEVGVPFIHTVKRPVLVRANIKSQYHKELSADSSDVKINGELRVLLANKIQGRFGFVTPFEHRLYSVGVDEKTHAYLPVQMDLSVEPMKSFDLQLRPLVEEPEIALLRHSVVPYTSNHDVYDFRPVMAFNNTQLVRRMKTRAPFKLSVSLGSDVIVVKRESDDYDSPDNTKPDALFSLWPAYETHYRKFDVYLNADKVEDKWLSVFASYDKVDFDAYSTEHLKPRKISALKAKIPARTDKQNQNVIKKKFVEDIGKNIRNNVFHMFNVTVGIPSKSSQVFFGIAQDGGLDRTTQFLLFWNLFSTKRQENLLEACVSGKVETTSEIFLDYAKLVSKAQVDNLDAEIMFGKDCTHGDTIVIKGNQTRSEHRMEAILDYETVKQCQQQMKEGHRGLRACEKANTLAGLRDELELVAEYKSDILKAKTYGALQYIENIFPNVKREILNPREADKKIIINMKVNLSPDLDKANISVGTPDMQVSFPSFDVTPISEFFGASSSKDLFETSLEKLQGKGSCTLEKDKAVTFDDKVYPIKLGKCWHVMTTVHQMENSDIPNESLSIPTKRRVIVLVRDVDDNNKEVKLKLANHEVHMEVFDGRLRVIVNGQQIDLSQSRYRLKDKDEIVFEIFQLPDNVIRFVSDAYEFNAVYDGQLIRVELFDDYRNAVRGLCGNFDGDKNNDFVTPKNCLLRKPYEFAAMFALTDNDCQGPVLKNKEKAEQALCVQLSHRPSNVISDLEAGRESTEGPNWGYWNKTENRKTLCNVHRTRVVEKDEELCFSVKPLPLCAEGCQSIELKSKKYPIHCMSKDKDAKLLRNRIEKGANPDLSQRTISEMYAFEVPITCVAA